MKTLFVLLALSISVAQAQSYRCQNNGKTTFQDTPCQTGGSKFDYGEDISVEKQKAAQSQLKQEMHSFNKKKQEKHEAWQKERVIRAQEDAADAGYDNARAGRAQAYQQKRTADAIRNKNSTKASKIRY